MTRNRKFALFWYRVVALLSLVFGLLYVSSREFTSYHKKALGVSWEELNDATQTLLLALMDVGGGGMLAMFIFLVALTQWPFRRGERWARFTIPIGILALYVPTLIATLNVLLKTPGDPPWYLALAACAAAVIGFVVDRPWSNSDQDAKEQAAN